MKYLKLILVFLKGFVIGFVVTAAIMFVVFMLFMSLSGCTNHKDEVKPFYPDKLYNEFLKIKCKEMYELIGKKYLSEYSYGPVCELDTPNGYYHFNKDKAEGFILGAKVILNKDKYKPFLKCLKRDECEKYKSEYYNECYEKCAKEIRWEI